jgi:HYR domain
MFCSRNQGTNYGVLVLNYNFNKRCICILNPASLIMKRIVYILLLAFCFSGIKVEAQNMGVPTVSPTSATQGGQEAINKSFTLSGSEHAIVNGVYALNGLNRLGQPRYTHSSNNYDLNYDGNGTWWLNTDKNLSGGARYYRGVGSAEQPPLAGWIDDQGQQTAVTLVAGPLNAIFDAQKSAPKPVITYLSREGTDDIDPNQVIEVKQVQATQILNGGATTISKMTNAENGFPADGYLYNLRVGWYRINDPSGNCSFSGENPDPRYQVSTGFGFSQTINPGDDKECGWQRLNNDGRYMLSNNYEVTSTASPFQFTLDVFSWEEDACGSDNTYDDDCFTNDDDHPTSTSTTVTLDPSTMSLGYNSMDINWSGNGAQYGLRLEWELLPALKIVTMYSDANLNGRTQDFGAGSYNVNSLFTGVGNDNISSMQIAPGYKVITYNNNNYIGYPIEFRGTVNAVGGPNDRISSFQVVPDDGAPSTDKTLLIYFNGSGKSLEFQLQRFATQVNADQMIFIKGVGGETKNYAGYNQNNLQYKEEDEVNRYEGFDAFNPFPTTFYSNAKVFKNDNYGGGTYRYFFGVDMDYDGSVGAGYEDEDSYTAAANVLRVLGRYNLKGYSRIIISGHSRGSAVGISSFLYGLKKAVENDPKFNEFQGLINDIFSSATTINVLALDPVAGANTPGLRNDYHMGDTWRAREIYQWLKGQYSNINFSEIYANGGRMLEADEILGLGGFFPNNTFDPSPNYLHVEPSNNVQRYWLGYRHSTMVNKDEKWSYIYDQEGIQRPWLLTSAMLNAAFQDQTLFRNYQHWYDAFHVSDQRAWLQALEVDGCTDSPSAQLGLDPLSVPDSDLEFQHYHGTRHKTFNNSDDSPVNMDDFVGNNNIKFHCSDESKTVKDAGLSNASNSHTDTDGWTHYCSCQGKRLLSLKLGGTGADVQTSGVSLKETNTNYFVPAGTGFITNPNGAVVMGRSWNVNPTTQPSSNVGVRFYFRQSDFDNINTHLTVLRNQPALSSVNRLFMYKATSGSTHADVSDIPTANILYNGLTPSTNNWLAGLTLRGEYYAEYQVTSFSGGGAGGSNCVSPTASIVVTDNCGSSFLDLTSNATSFLWSNQAVTADITVAPGTYTVTVTNSTDGCTATASITTTGDSQAPSIACPANITVANTTNLCSAIASYTAPVGTDNCSNPSTIRTDGLDSGVLYPVGTTTNIFKVTDGVGNTATCAFTVTVSDTQLPTISCPANISVANTTNLCSATVNYIAPLGADNCSNPSTIQTDGLTSGASYPVGITTNIFKVTDGSSNSATCAFTVTVSDTQKPIITCPANISINNTQGECSGVATYVSPVGTDNCSNPNTTQTSGLLSGSMFPVGSTINGFRVTDGAGNTATCAFTVTVSDTQVPTIACPANISISNTQGECSGVATYIAPVGMDNCSNPNTMQTSGLVSGGMFPVGSTINGFRVTDGAGNTATCAFTVTVSDTQLPTITCPPNVSVSNVQGQCSGVATYTTPIGTDNCSNPNTTQTAGISSGGTFPLGATTNRFQVMDGAGNTASCAFTVTVSDTQIPTITCPSNIAIANLQGQCSAMASYTAPVGADNCSNPSTMQTAGLVSGSTFPGGVTTNVFRVTDGAGNTTTCSFTVTVLDAQAPSITCPANIVRPTDLNLCGAVVTYTLPIYSDNCSGGGASHISGGTSGSTFAKGTTTVNWQATDGVGLTKTCSFTITVNDGQVPTITCPANMVRNSDAGQCSAVVTYTTPAASDNCSLPAGQPQWVSGGTTPTASGVNSTATFQKGANIVTWKATDSAGLTKTCSFRVTVNDTQAPTMTCPAAISVSTATNVCNAVATYTNPTFTDNCAPTSGTATRISGPVSGATFPIGNSNVVFQATDASGNTRRCTMVVTVTDNQPPVINCPAAVVATGTGTPCRATVFYSSTTAFDNCAGTLTPFLVTGLASGSQFPAGVTTNTFRAVAPNGQSAECSFSVTIDCGSGMGNNGVEVRNADLSIQHGAPLELKLAPNPALSTVTVSIEGVGAKGGTLLVYDAVGRLVLRQVIAEDQRTAVFQVEGSEFASGLYRVNLRTETGMVTKTLVVVK